MKYHAVRVNDSMHKRVKLYAVKNEMSLQQAMTELLDLALKKSNKNKT